MLGPTLFFALIFLIIFVAIGYFYLENFKCSHQWGLDQKIKSEGIMDDLLIYIYICKKCGKFKKVKI